MGRTKKILAWIEAFSYLVDQDIKYFEKSINTQDKKESKNCREISDWYSDRTKELINDLP